MNLSITELLFDADVGGVPEAVTVGGHIAHPSMHLSLSYLPLVSVHH